MLEAEALFVPPDAVAAGIASAAASATAAMMRVFIDDPPNGWWTAHACSSLCGDTEAAWAGRVAGIYHFATIPDFLIPLGRMSRPIRYDELRPSSRGARASRASGWVLKSVTIR